MELHVVNQLITMIEFYLPLQVILLYNTVLGIAHRMVHNPPPATTYNVTLTVNTANITVGPNGMYAGGGF